MTGRRNLKNLSRYLQDYERYPTEYQVELECQRLEDRAEIARISRRLAS